MSFDQSKHPRGHDGNPGQFERGGGGTATLNGKPKPKGIDWDSDDPLPKLTNHADKLASQTLKKAGGILPRLGKAGAWLKNKTKQVYNALENRYGRGPAIAIFAAGHVVGLASPLAILPGSTILGMAPFAALAEVYLQARRGIKAVTKHDEGQGLSPDEIKRLGKKLVEGLCKAWADRIKAAHQAFAEYDPRKHPHKGKGAGGGQFAKKGAATHEADCDHCGKKNDVHHGQTKAGCAHCGKSFPVEWGKPIKQKPKNSKVARALASHKCSTKEKQRHAEANEAVLTEKLGGSQSGDNLEMDVTVKTKLLHGIEVKTMLDNGNDKITMHPASRRRKEKWAKKTKGVIHTVVIDHRDRFDKGKNKHQYSGHELFYRRGVGAFRVGKLYRCKDYAELKGLLDMPEHQLPEGARP